MRKWRRAFFIFHLKAGATLCCECVVVICAEKILSTGNYFQRINWERFCFLFVCQYCLRPWDTVICNLVYLANVTLFITRLGRPKSVLYYPFHRILCQYQIFLTLSILFSVLSRFMLVSTLNL